MIRINLLPVRVSKKKQAGTQQLVLAALVLVAALGGNFWWTSSRAGTLADQEAKLARTKAELTRLDKILGEVKDIKEQQAAVKDKLAVLDRLKLGRSGPVRLLDDLATVIPKRVSLRKLDEKNGVVVFDGSAATIEDVSVFMSALERSEYFSRVELKKTAAKEDPGHRIVEFTLTATANYTPGVAVAQAAPAAAPAKGR
jgi:type IV pilus assembly protein PilN